MTVSAQTPAAFEAADIHPSLSQTAPSGGFLPNGRVEFRAATLLHLISVAWDIPPGRIARAPSWLDTDRFDVIAKAAQPASRSEMRSMLRALLMARFHLNLENLREAVPVYALEPEPGHKAPAPGSGKPGCADGDEETLYVWICHNTTVAALAGALPGLDPQYFDQPVVDRSGLTGAFDFRLEWTSRTEPHAVSLYSSISKQLGLKVAKTTEPMQVFAVVHIDRTPAPNPPDTLSKLGPAPGEFEVADIEPSRPGQSQFGRFRNGRFDYRGMTLRQFIFLATRVNQDWIFGGEKWLDTDHFDILAETAPTSFDTVRGLIAAMLRERFHFSFHTEQRTVSVNALEASKPDLQPADPDELSTCTASAGDGTSILTCRNMTMARFAERLGDEPGIDDTLIDQTGLTGSYNFSLAWSPRAQHVAGRRREANLANSATPQASDPLPGLTILEALNRQLGLRVKEVKHSMTVLVIDHLDRTPTPN